MSTPLLDLGPGELDIKFEKGVTFNPILFYLGADNSVINLTGYGASFQVRNDPADASPIIGWDLAVGTGITLVQGTAIAPDGTVVPNAWGVQPTVSAANTAAITWTKAYYKLTLTHSGSTLPMLKGKMEPVW